MTLRLVFRAAAKRDLAQLGAQSERQWGTFQTRHYLDKMEAKIQMLSSNPMLGHDAGYLRPGLRRMNSGRHAVFYLVADDQIEVVRVLHVASDLERKL